MIRELDGARLEAVLPAPPPARLFHFRRPDGSEVVVGWSAADKPVRATLPRPAVNVTGRDGREMPVGAAAAGVEVDLGPSPRYFRLS